MQVQCPQCASRLSFDQLSATLSLSGDSSSITDSATPPLVTSTLGDYEIESEIARGGMGIVLRARQISLDRPVALKVIGRGELATAEEVDRFRTEARAAANLDHPGIVPVYEVGCDNDTHFFSMGLIEGKSLSARLADGPLEPTEAASITKAIADAIQYAHDHGILHRDLKPQNILLDGEGTPRVTDFGLAKELQSDSELTHTGQVLGTPSYMSPEQARGQEVGKASDIYSLGALLYCLITGRPPHQAASAAETLILVLNCDICPPRKLNSRIPRDLETLCMKALDGEPGNRFASARDLGDELQRYIDGKPIRSRPIGPLRRGLKLCRRYPKTAAMLCLLLISVSGAIGLAWYGTIQRQAAEHQKIMNAHTTKSHASSAKYMRVTKQIFRERVARERSLGFVRAAEAYMRAGSYDESMAALQKALAVENTTEEMHEKVRGYIRDLEAMMSDSVQPTASES